MSGAIWGMVLPIIISVNVSFAEVLAACGAVIYRVRQVACSFDPANETFVAETIVIAITWVSYRGASFAIIGCCPVRQIIVAWRTVLTVGIIWRRS